MTPMEEVRITPVSKPVRDAGLLYGLQPVAKLGIYVRKVLVDVFRERTFRMHLIGPEHPGVTLKGKIGISLGLGPRHLPRQSRKSALGREPA